MSERPPWMSELEAYQADLRAQVEALPPWRVLQGGGAEWLNRAEVLALIDGSSHGPS